MRRLVLRCAVLFLVAAAPGAIHADALKETWYLMRSRANMQIGNYAAAIEAYEKYLELKPDDREALRGIAIAHERQGQTDKAISRFDAYLAKYPDDHEIAFKQADYLTWSRYAYRKDDAVRYLRNGLASQNDPKQRLKYARLLAADKYDLDESVKQYQRLLADAPENEAVRDEYRGVLLWDDKYTSTAVVEYERLVQREPAVFEHRLTLAELLSKEPRRLRDSARWYAQLVAEKPGDKKIRHEYAKVLARAGDNRKEREQYALLVRKQPSYTMLSEYGGLLASEKNTRAEAIDVYSKMLGQRPNDTATRVRRGELYMTDKRTAGRALSDFKRVLAREPNNARAHRGAAQAYAWLGESDLALHHSQQAQRHGRNTQRASALTRELSQGREPRLTALLQLPWQSGDEFELSGFVLGALVRGDVSPFMTASAGLGIERYEGEDDDESGSWYRLGLQYRADSRRRFDVEFGNRSVRRVGASQHWHLQYTDESNPVRAFTAGIFQTAVGDSFQSLVGDDDADLGGATRSEIYATYDFREASFDWSLRPAIGRVASSSESSNSYVRGDGSIVWSRTFNLPFTTAFGYDAAVATYNRDHSGFVDSDSEPRSGGYFSPQLLIDQLPFARIRHTLSDGGELELKAGLRIQYVDDDANSGDTATGLAGRFSYTRKNSPSQYLTGSIEHDSIGDRYDRTVLQGQMVFIF